MAPPEVDRATRWVGVLGLAVCLGFSIPYNIFAHNAIAVLFIVPMVFSALINLFHLSKRTSCKPADIFLDVAMATALMGTLIPGLILVRTRGWHGDVLLQIGTLASVPSIVNFSIHAYTALRDMGVFEGIRQYLAAMTISPTCPHCQREVLFQRGAAPRKSGSSAGDAHSYDPVSMRDNEEDEQPSSSKQPHAQMSEYKDDRPSTDSETARLV